MTSSRAAYDASASAELSITRASAAVFLAAGTTRAVFNTLHSRYQIAAWLVASVVLAAILGRRRLTRTCTLVLVLVLASTLGVLTVKLALDGLNIDAVRNRVWQVARMLPWRLYLSA